MTLADLENLTFPAKSIASIILACLLLTAIPFVFWIVWQCTHKGQTKFRYLLIGAIGFIVSARVLELGVHMLCIVLDNPISRFINGHTAAYVIYGTMMAGVFEECGRYFILKYLLKDYRTPENAVLYGIGHGGIEVLTVVMPVYVLYLVIAVLFSVSGSEAAASLLNITDETAQAALPTVQAAAAFGIGDAAVGVWERLMAMLVHIALTVVVYHGVAHNEKKYLFLAVVLHMAVDTAPALYQRGVMSIGVTELCIIPVTAVLVFIAWKLYKRQKSEISEVQTPPAEGIEK